MGRMTGLQGQFHILQGLSRPAGAYLRPPDPVSYLKQCIYLSVHISLSHSEALWKTLHGLDS